MEGGKGLSIVVYRTAEMGGSSSSINLTRGFNPLKKKKREGRKSSQSRLAKPGGPSRVKRQFRKGKGALARGGNSGEKKEDRCCRGKNDEGPKRKPANFVKGWGEKGKRKKF